MRSQKIWVKYLDFLIETWIDPRQTKRRQENQLSEA